MCMSPSSKAQQKAVTKYIREKYDRIVLTMPKGKRDIIKAHAEEYDKSLNSFINRAIDMTMEIDKMATTWLEPDSGQPVLLLKIVQKSSAPLLKKE